MRPWKRLRAGKRGTVAAVKAGSTGGRVASLDALRGFDMFWIIGGDTIVRSLPALSDAPWTRLLARQVEHNAWRGFDVLRPDFPAVPLYHRRCFPVPLLLKRVETGKARTRVYLHIVRRTLILIFSVMAGGLEGSISPTCGGRASSSGSGSAIFSSRSSCSTRRYGPRSRSSSGSSALLGGSGARPRSRARAEVMTPEGSLHSYIDQRVMPGRISAEFYGPGDSLGRSRPFRRPALFCWAYSPEPG